MPKDQLAILMCNDDFCRNFGNDYISKDKIKAKIEELEENNRNSETNIYGYGIYFLQELLQEE